VEAVLGLDNRPQVRPHFRARITKRGFPAGFTPTTLASLYDFPSGTGKGVCIGVIEFGGGYRIADLQRYFSDINSALPKVSSVSVNHARNHATGDPNGPDGEVMLDIEVAGTIAPEAEIVVYFAPNTDAGFFDAVSTAIHDEKNGPSVISISWGGSEASWTPQAMAALDQAFQAAALMGITVCVASGDNGSSGGAGIAGLNVDFPASSPHVLACGGTSLQAVNGDIRSETVWNDGAAGGASGGGVSCFFPLPPWQNGLHLTSAQGKKTHQCRQRLAGRVHQPASLQWLRPQRRDLRRQWRLLRLDRLGRLLRPGHAGRPQDRRPARGEGLKPAVPC
jgi:kumamolisin